MDAFFNALGKKCFQRLSLIGVFIFAFVGTLIILFLPANETREQDDFRCYNTKGEKTKDQLRDRCYDEYNKKFNRKLPLYVFTLLNFSTVLLICLLYSQYVRVQVENTMKVSDLNTNSQQSIRCTFVDQNIFEHGVSSFAVGGFLSSHFSKRIFLPFSGKYEQFYRKSNEHHFKSNNFRLQER